MKEGIYIDASSAPYNGGIMKCKHCGGKRYTMKAEATVYTYVEYGRLPFPEGEMAEVVTDVKHYHEVHEKTCDGCGEDWEPIKEDTNVEK